MNLGQIPFPIPPFGPFSLLKVHLQLRNYSVFLDVVELEAGKFDENLLLSVRAAKNFILVLTPNALDRFVPIL